MLNNLKVVAINVLVFVLLLAGLEVYWRTKESRNVLPPLNSLSLYTFPYYMFSAEPETKVSQYENIYTNEKFPANVIANNRGFNDRHDFHFTPPYQKADNERVVLFTGGSTAWGTGAAWTETIQGRIEHYLNSMQKDLKYTVINLGMGSWIAYQQFIGLEMWGSRFDPDWVVVMDGHNDAGVGCAYSQGVINPLYYPAMKGIVEGYLGSTNARPTFYRGWFENEIIKYSVAYRSLTGKNYIANPLIYDEQNDDDTRGELRKIIVPTKIGEARAMLAFYVKAQEAIVGLFPNARYILSTQPIVNQFTGEFVDVSASEDPKVHRGAMDKRSRDLDLYLRANEAQWCNAKSFVSSFVYIYVKGAFEVEQLAERFRSKGRFVEYYNTGLLFPNERNDRLPFFIDAAHLTDKGADVLGKFYAERILSGEGKTYQPIVPPDGINVVAASYGRSCGASADNITSRARFNATVATAAIMLSMSTSLAIQRRAVAKISKWNTLALRAVSDTGE